MLQDMQHMEASCLFYVEVGTHNRPEQSKISILTVSTLGVAMLTFHHYMMYSICFMSNPGDNLRQTSVDILSGGECAVYIPQTRDFGGHSPRCIPIHKHTTLDRLGAHCRMVGNLCNLQLYTAGLILCRM